MSDLEFDPLDQRRHPRLVISKSVRAIAVNVKTTGMLVDISASGAAIDLDGELDTYPDDETEIELEIDDISPLAGYVARSFEEGLAVEFDLNQEEEDQLLSEVMQICNEMNLDDA